MEALEGTTFGSILMTFLISMVPVLELRAAIPAGVIAGLDIKIALLTAVIGNLVPIPFIIVFIRKIFKWMQSKSERLAKVVKHFEQKLLTLNVQHVKLHNVKQIRQKRKEAEKWNIESRRSEKVLE